MSSRNYHIRKYGAVEQPDGSYLHNRDGQVYWYNEAGEVHREDGPAIVYPTDDVAWYLYGDDYEFADWLIELNKSDEVKMMLRLRYV
jgi:hypothetical protein